MGASVSSSRPAREPSFRRQRQFWLVLLVNVGLTATAAYLDRRARPPGGTVTGLFGLAIYALVCAGITALFVRRLQGGGRSGWWTVVACLPPGRTARVGRVAAAAVHGRPEPPAPVSRRPSAASLRHAQTGYGVPGVLRFFLISRQPSRRRAISFSKPRSVGR